MNNASLIKAPTDKSVVGAMGKINFEGNIIPVEWFNHLKLSNGKPDTIAILLLSDIVYWYRPTTIRDESSGRVVGYKKKFKADLLQKSYQDYESLFGFSRKQIKEALVRLEGHGLIERVFRTIQIKGQVLSNVMFLSITPAKIVEITNRSDPMSLQGHTYVPKSTEGYPSKDTPMSLQGQTYTETTTQITTNNSLSRERVDVRSASEENLREREMLEIWNDSVEQEPGKVNLGMRRKQLLQQVLRENFDSNIDQWKSYCLRITSSKFLMGEITSFKVSIDWALKPEVIQKISEGQYGIGDRDIKHSEKKISMEEVNLEIHSSNDPESLKLIKEHLLHKVGVATYNSWLKNLVFLNQEGNTIVLKTPSEFVRDYIRANLEAPIIESCRDVTTTIKKVDIV